MNVLKLHVLMSLLIAVFANKSFADAVCDECMDQKEKEQSIILNSSVHDAMKVADTIDASIINDELNAKLCAAMRSQVDSLENPNFNFTEFEMIKMAGVNDITKENSASLREKLQRFWKNNHQKLECKGLQGKFPKGNYLKQLMAGHYKSQLNKFMRSYRLDPNVIDDVDGCTALDYINAQIQSSLTYTDILINKFKEYREILLKYGAKTANELGGKC